jgi:hypothetical protein
MARRWIILWFVAAFLMPALAGAVSQEDFKAATTQNLMNLCSASTDDPLYREAHNFCQGYLVGAYHYHVAQTEGPDGKRLICFPDPPPSRVQAISMFIEWVKAHPQYLIEKPVDTQFRFLMEKWPCKP